MVGTFGLVLLHSLLLRCRAVRQFEGVPTRWLACYYLHSDTEVEYSDCTVKSGIGVVPVLHA